MEQNEQLYKEIKNNARFTVECLSLNHEGQGVCKITGIKDGELFENYPIFVDELLKGERGIIEITKVSKTYGYAKIVTLFKETKSSDHVVPKCLLSKECGGCNLMHMSYDLQLRFKQQMVKETMEKIGKLNDVNVLPTIGMDVPYEYRNKVQVPFRKKGFKTICGFFKRDSHNVVPFSNCLIQPEISSQIINFTRNLCNEYKVTGYNELDNSGLIRHVLVRTNSDLSQIMVVLVLTSRELPNEESIVKKLITRYPNIKSIVKNINNVKGNTILGDEVITIYGSDTITDELCGLKFNIGPKSFYQVNHQQTEKLYQKVVELATLKDTDTVIDAYCGIGTIGLIVSKHVKEVYSVEIINEAIKNAKINAKVNKIKNITFVCNKAENQIKLWQKSDIKADVIIVDPPRKGCDKSLLETIDEMRIPKIVYVSCDPATLARDLCSLKEKGYYINNIQPVDMFPQTSNVECVVCLEKR
ncbi:23S rRNA (Uracil-5-)-methyltransferase RumA [Firmicutes bacterium CAG:313]|nr:23S rRNA (Uracil-5-)-methyltransferase RumA [Firmicutes bacterium CAG:313]